MIDSDRFQRRVAAMKNIRLELEGQFTPDHFEYIDFDDAELLECVWFGMTGWVAVIGHPENGSYEWVGRHDAHYDRESQPRYERSNDGWGGIADALLAGMKAMVPG